ncbi:MAG: type III pantothenate kinase [Clostridia bacterium]|nr:type III pantothenate kinase [Clostridia bacterium]
MLLLVDVGNTNIVFGIYDRDHLVSSWRMSTRIDRSLDEMGMQILQFLKLKEVKTEEIEDIIMASVVPQIMYPLCKALKSYVGREPIVVDGNTDLGMKNKYDNPREVGADRLVNAVAAKALYGTPCIIVDFGTATTFCAVDKAGDYLGGSILPGIKISLDALFSKTAKLPKIEIEDPGRLIGTNTIASMQSGIFYGYVGSVDYIVMEMAKELGGQDVKVIATGGLSSLISTKSKTIQTIDRKLTLTGLKLIYDMLKGKQA